MSGLTDLEQRCVVPFYLKMMGLNALGHDVPFDSLREVARGTTDYEVAELLVSHWRPRVMGAWLASGRTQRLEAALLESLETSLGSLTAPPLATVALHGLGMKAVPSLKTYLRLDLEHQWGSASFIAAVLERLDATPTGVAIDDQDRRAVDGMLSVARCLAEAEPDVATDAAN
ncbi:DUF6000 family protein [Microbispora rosea]|uniref:DUF6000 family protein n=1 Tax=Microbispora rosea TaxID=58117 RepID=UPI0037B7101A